MELSPDTIEHLRDEAYATLCRHALTEALETLEREKATLATTRPPFGLLARKQTRDAFTRSMHAATGTEAALRTRLGQVLQLEQWLQDRLRAELHAYLNAISEDYRRFATVEQHLDQWEAEFRALPELLLAFARDVRHAQQAATPASGLRDLHPFAVLRDTALRLEQQLNALDRLVAQFSALLPADAAAEIRVPALPDFRRVAWVNRIAALSAEHIVAETSRVEREVREFIANGQATVPLRLQAAHEACQRHEDDFLQHYWRQLRAHAQMHYVEERDIDAVLAELTHRYVTNDLDRRQRELATADLFLAER